LSIHYTTGLMYYNSITNVFFAQSLRLPRGMRSLFLWGQAPILILKILHLFGWLRSSPFSKLNKFGCFTMASFSNWCFLVFFHLFSLEDFDFFLFFGDVFNNNCHFFGQFLLIIFSCNREDLSPHLSVLCCIMKKML